MVESTALGIGSGGFESYFECKEGKVYERLRANNTNAYMLVYVRETEREDVMAEVTMD
jgi:hypothetical protein